MTTTTRIDNTMDIIDSRQIIERITELEDWEQITEEMDSDDREELEALRALVAEAEGYSPDWSYGVPLIRDTYFEEYAQQTAEDTCPISGGMPNHWPFDCIDWKRAARELQQDYTSIEFDDVTYWIQ